MCGVQYTRESVLHRHHKARGPPKRHKSRLLASHDTQATRGNQQRIQSLCRSCQPGGCAVQPGVCIVPPPQSSRTLKRHKSRLLASHDKRATTIEPAAYPVPLSSLSTRRMCSTTGRVYSTTTTKLKDRRNVTSPALGKK